MSITTSRIELSDWTDGDIEALKDLQADPEVMTYLPDGPIEKNQNAASIDEVNAYWQSHGYGKWALKDRKTREFMGFVGLSFPGHWPSPEISWTIAPKFWNRGYATEAARGALNFGFDKAGLDRIISVALVSNIASERVMQKLGMERTDDTTCPLRHIPVVVYAMTKEAWVEPKRVV